MDKNIDMKNKKNKENPLHLMKRLLGYILKNYKFRNVNYRKNVRNFRQKNLNTINGLGKMQEMS